MNRNYVKISGNHNLVIQGDNEFTEKIIDEIRQLKNFPRIEVNQTYISLNQKIDGLKERENYLKTEIEHRKAESDKELENSDKERNNWLIQSAQRELIKTNTERIETEKRLNNFIIEIINLSKFLQTQNIVTERGKEAERLFYLGKFEEAINVLNDEDIYTDIKSGKEGLKGYAKELLFKAKAIEITQPDGCFDQAKRYYEDAIKTYEDFDTCLLYAHFLGKYQYNSQALKYYERAFLDTSAESDENRYKIYPSLAICLMNIGKYKHSEEYFSKSIILAKLLNKPKEDIVILYSNLGLSFQTQNDYANSMIAFDHARKVLEEIGDEWERAAFWRARTFTDIAFSLSRMLPDEIVIRPNLSSMQDLNSETKELVEKVINELSDEEKIASSQRLARENYEKAIDCFKNGLPTENDEWLAGLFDTLFNFANFQSTADQAKPILSEALLIAKKLFEINPLIYLKDLAKIQHRMYDLQMSLGDFVLAHENLQKAVISYRYLMDIDPVTFGEKYAKALKDIAVFNLTHKEISKETCEVAKHHARLALQYYVSPQAQKLKNIKSHINECEKIITEATIRDYKLEEKENDG